MAYLSVVNFWKYQNADVWKKSKTHPPWFKHYVHRDQELDHLSLAARLLFWELVATATRYSNVLEDDLKWLWAETRIEPETIAEELPKLVKGGWLSQTQSRRRSRELSRKNLDESLEPIEEEVDVDIEDLQLEATTDDIVTSRPPRASPNGLAAKRPSHHSLVTYAHQFWDEYPDKDILQVELTDRGATLDEALAILAAEAAARQDIPIPQ